MASYEFHTTALPVCIIGAIVVIQGSGAANASPDPSLGPKTTPAVLTTDANPGSGVIKKTIVLAGPDVVGNNSKGDAPNEIEKLADIKVYGIHNRGSQASDGSGSSASELLIDGTNDGTSPKSAPMILMPTPGHPGDRVPYVNPVRNGNSVEEQLKIRDAAQQETGMKPPKIATATIVPLPLLPKLSIIGGGYGSVGKWDTGTLPLLTVGGSSSSLGSNSFLTSGSVPRVALCPKDTFAHGFNRLYVRERASKSRLETAMTGLELYCQRPESQQEDNDKIVGVTLNEAKRLNHFHPGAKCSEGTFISGFQVLAPTQTAPQLTGDGVHAGLGDVKAHCSDGINLFTGPAPSPDISKNKSGFKYGPVTKCALTLAVCGLRIFGLGEYLTTVQFYCCPLPMETD